MTTKQAAPATPLQERLSKTIYVGNLATDEFTILTWRHCAKEYPRLMAERAELVAALRLGRSAEDHLARQALLRKLGAA